MPASPVIPKEQLAGIQRWELGTFTAPRTAHASGLQSGASQSERAKEISMQARTEGYRAGHAEGLQAGRNEALAELGSRVARMDAMLATLEQDLARVDRELSADVVQLGLAVARQLVGAALEAKPEIIQSCVEEALRQVAHANSAVHVAVNPEDAAFVRPVLEASPRSAGWSLREDPRIGRGGCRVETASGEVDATLENRWHRVTTALGMPAEWIKP